MPGVHGRDMCLLISERMLEGQGLLGDFSRNKGLNGHYFIPMSLSIHMEDNYQNQCGTNTWY